MLSTGGKAILIKHVRSAIPMNLLSICQPPKTVLRNLERYFGNYFWEQQEGNMKHHFVAWTKLCYPFEDGGVGFKSLYDIYISFKAKLWWLFRTRNSLWSTFLKAKYCSRLHPVARKGKAKYFGLWRSLADIKKYIEPNIL